MPHDDGLIRLRTALGVSGVFAAAIAVGADSRLLAWVAAGLLAASLLLRLIKARARHRAEPDDADSSKD